MYVQIMMHMAASTATSSSASPRLYLSLDETRDWVCSLHEFISSHRGLCDAHAVDFFTEHHWTRVVREEWKDDLRAIRDTDQLVHPAAGGSKGSLQDLLYTASRLRLPLQSLGPPSDPLIFGMTPKKSHEVGRTSQLIAGITDSHSVKQVLDLGSGKGYLSQHLTLCYGLTVVGMDSQDTNTAGALKRNKKTHKAWKSYRNKESHPSNKARDLSKHTSTECVPETAVDLEDDLALNSLFESNADTCITQDHYTDPEESQYAEPESVHTETAKTPPPEEYIGQQGDKADDSISDFTTTYRDSHEVGACLQKTSVPSYFPITKTIDVLGNKDLLQVAEVETSAAFVASQPCCLVGLHTCGDLAATGLRLFAQLSGVRVACVVGCCYHLITESPDGKGFPMSAYLNSIDGTLGRTARMLACQTLYKIAHTTQGDLLKVGLFRAVLQVLIMREIAGDEEASSTQFIVGKQRRVPATFEEYARVTSRKLGFDLTHIPDEQLGALHTEYVAHIHELEMFLQLRAVIAPCIESLIILDRLLFLQEQDSTKEAFLVQLFDPSLSPRCFAIVAHKA